MLAGSNWHTETGRVSTIDINAGSRLQAVYLDFPPCLAVQLRAGKEVTTHAHRTMDPGDVPGRHVRESGKGSPVGVREGEEWKTWSGPRLQTTCYKPRDGACTTHTHTPGAGWDTQQTREGMWSVQRGIQLSY